MKKSVAGISFTPREQEIYDVMRRDRHTYSAEQIAAIYYRGDKRSIPSSWRVVILRIMRNIILKSRLLTPDRPLVRVSRLGTGAPAEYRVLTEREHAKIEANRAIGRG